MVSPCTILAGLLLAAGPAPAKTLEAWIPPEAMVAYVGHPQRSPSPDGDGVNAARLSTWMLALGAAGVIPEQGRVIADVIATLPLLNHRSHAMVLLDITARQLREDVYRLDELRAAMILQGTRDAPDIDRRIRDLLVSYTSADTAHVETITAGKVRYYRMTDTRLPGWAVVEWGTAHDCYLVGFGRGVIETLLRTADKPDTTLAADGWFRRAQEACHADAGLMSAYVNLAQLRRRVGEVVKGRPRQVLGTLYLGEVRRLYWTLGFDDRALRSEIFTLDEGDETRYVMLAGPQLADPGVASAIPRQADHYGVFRTSLPELFRTAWDAYRQSKSDQWRESWSEAWSEIEQAYRFDLDRDLIDYLGEHLVIHTYPPHPLRMPPLWTFWIEHRGDRERIGATIDKLMRIWQEHLERQAAKGGSALIRPQLKRDEEGIWYLQLGIVGPAIGVADRWIVVSYSPTAVRKNLRHLAARAATSPN